MNSGNLNFLEPSGPLQACSGTDFFFCLITGFVSGKQRLLKEDYEFLIINLIKDCYNLISYNYIEPEQYNPWNNSTNKSQAPEDGCINIRNMLSIK